MKFSTKEINVLHRSKVIIDTCFAMHEHFPLFAQSFLDNIKNNPIILPKVVIDELEKCKKSGDSRKEIAANRGLTKLVYMQQQQKDSIEIRGDPVDNGYHADPIFLSAAQRMRLKHPVLVLTQDRGLIDDLINLNNQKSSDNRVYPVRCLRLKNEGSIDILSHEDSFNLNYSQRSTKSDQGHDASTITPFAIKKVAHIDATPTNMIGRIKNIEENEILINKKTNEQLVIGKRISAGGEGTIFEVKGNPSFVCKIYRTDKLMGRERKIDLMLSRQVAVKSICWPLAKVVDVNGTFRGFVMNRAVGTALGTSLMRPFTFLTKYPSWTRIESVALSISILENIRFLHSLNVLIGDINELNILVDFDHGNQVYFVDCDSFQVEEYPCPVGSINFTPPELQGIDFTTILRTQHNELFSIATLLFMILVPGKTPYSHQGGTDGKENIARGHFPYRRPGADNNTQIIAPMGPWRMCWSHLDAGLRDAFVQSFDKATRDQKRISVDHWFRLLHAYQTTISNSVGVFKGPQRGKARSVGYDLSILPANRRYVVAEHIFPDDEKTDLERQAERITREAARSYRGGGSPLPVTPQPVVIVKPPPKVIPRPPPNISSIQTSGPHTPTTPVPSPPPPPGSFKGCAILIVIAIVLLLIVKSCS